MSLLRYITHPNVAIDPSTATTTSPAKATATPSTPQGVPPYTPGDRSTNSPHNPAAVTSGRY
jgi:hypothetical protein